MAELTEITSGLRFPEGPIAMPDGSVILVEMFGPRITRVLPDGTKQTIAEIEGGPNGAAIGPDGAIYLCNNGGCFTPVDMGELLFPGPFDPSRYIGGRIQKVDIATGAVTDLYTELQLLSEAMAKAKSTDPVKVAAALEGLKLKSYNGEIEMRRTDHQLQQELYISVWQKTDAKNPYSVENTGYTFAPVAHYDAYVASTPTSCQMKRPG